MNEIQWLAATDPDPMCQYLEGIHLALRKPRLLAAAWCARYRHRHPDFSLEEVLSLVEQFADGLVGQDGLHLARRMATELVDKYDGGIAVFYHAALAAQAATSDALTPLHLTDVSCDIANAAISAEKDRALRRKPALNWTAPTKQAAAAEAERRTLAERVRDVFGNPFRPVTFNPAWRTLDVMLLAQGIYDECAFDRMPILADALQDANCDSDDILNHLRDANAKHVRGCWALDMVLGKE